MSPPVLPVRRFGVGSLSLADLSAEASHAFPIPRAPPHLAQRHFSRRSMIQRAFQVPPLEALPDLHHLLVPCMLTTHLSMHVCWCRAAVAGAQRMQRQGGAARLRVPAAPGAHRARTAVRPRAAAAGRAACLCGRQHLLSLPGARHPVARSALRARPAAGLC